MSGSDALFDQYGKTFSEGDIVFHENETGQMMFLIRKGKIRIYKTFLEQDSDLTGGKKLERELVVLESGDFFGEMSLLNHEPRAATAVCLTDTEVLEINQETFENMVKTNGTFALKIISKLCMRVRNTDKIIEEILIHYKQRKIMDLLLELEKRFDNEIPVEELNQLIDDNTKLEEKDILEILNKLEKYDIIKMSGGLITILDSENLSKMKAFLET
ncbi:MAG: cyclic nucleotide-binding domain-containing protein [Spirochaetota bacterium]|nr:cyclic nucleotide-binding domain-containing protein [Spirochaetota bacterium]